MRKELKDIQQIEYYLQGKLSQEDKLQFEYQLTIDEELASNVYVQKLLMNRIRILYLKKIISNAHSRNVSGFNKGWFGTTSAITTTLIILSIIAFLFVKTEINPKQYIQNNTTLQLEIPDTLGGTKIEISKIDSVKQQVIVKKPPLAKPKNRVNLLNEHFFNSTKTYITKDVYVQKSKFIDCKKGTVIYLPDSCFNTEKEVQLTITEYKGAYDIFMAKLNTISNDQLLETQGMINIEATVDGESIPLRKDKRLVIMFAKSNEDKRVSYLYYGEKNNNGNMNWNIQTANMSDFTIKTNVSHNGSVTFHSIDYECFNEIPINAHIKTIQLNPIDYAILDNTSIYGTQRLGFSFVINEKGNIENLKNNKPKNIIHPTIAAKIIDHIKNFTISYELNNTPNNNTLLGNYNYFIFFIPKFDYNDFQEKVYDKYTTLTRGNLNYYVFSAQTTGWLNCDRLINISTPKVNMGIIEDSVQDSYFMLLLNSYNTYINPQLSNDRYVLKGIPSDTEATLVGVKYLKNQPLLSITKFVTGAKKIKPNKFEPFTFEELEMKLNNIRSAK